MGSSFGSSSEESDVRTLVRQLDLTRTTAEEESWEAEWLRMCLSSVETVLAVATEAQDLFIGKYWCDLSSRSA